ncbi:MAG: hypothetical protein V4719_16090 [Planctomycetota bacterium]
MTITDRKTGERHNVPEADVLFPMGRPKRPDWRMRCELWLFLLRSQSRVYVAGGEFGFDGLAREADDLEIRALADRFSLEELQEILTKRAALNRRPV